MKITQGEIAEKAGVSRTTVSIVLNNKSNFGIPEETRNNILRTAEELGYKKRFIQVPEDLKTGNIGYIIPFPEPGDFFHDPYYHRLLDGITAEGKKNKCGVLIYGYDRAFLSEIIISRKLDGLIVQTPLPADAAKKIKRSLPIVLLNCSLPQLDIDSVMPNNISGSIKAVSYLVSLGHKKIALFGMKPLQIHADEGAKGYIEGLKICDLEEVPEYIQLPKRKVGGMKEIEKLAEKILKLWLSLPDRPTAVITTGDGYALSLLKAANKAGLSLPDDLSIIGCDNTIACLYSHPALTSVDQPMEEMARKSVRILLERIKNPQKPVEHLVLDVGLVTRESTGKCGS